MPKDKAILFEFEDLAGFPDNIRRGMVDYLTFFLVNTNYYKPVIPLIAECIAQAEDKQILDMCSGGGGPMLKMCRHLNEHMGVAIPILLTDKFPNTDAYEYLGDESKGQISFVSGSVDARSVPSSLKGVRTCFSALHHFGDDSIREMLSSVTRAKAPVAIFDGGDKNIWTILGIILVHPLIFFFCTPFFKPFRLSRLFFTYILPVIPVCTIWDGVVSILRLHSPSKLEKLARDVDDDYIWKAGKIRHPMGLALVI